MKIEYPRKRYDSIPYKKKRMEKNKKSSFKKCFTIIKKKKELFERDINGNPIPCVINLRFLNKKEKEELPRFYKSKEEEEIYKPLGIKGTGYGFAQPLTPKGYWNLNFFDDENDKKTQKEKKEKKEIESNSSEIYDMVAVDTTQQPRGFTEIRRNYPIRWKPKKRKRKKKRKKKQHYSKPIILVEELEFIELEPHYEN